MKHRKLRRMAILALVLILAFNTLGAKAETTEKAPTVTVSTYRELCDALESAKGGEVIGITVSINIPTTAHLEPVGVIIKRMSPNAKLLFSNAGSDVGMVKNIFFDGNARGTGGTTPFIVIAGGNMEFNFCEFEDCIDEGGNGGAVYISSASVALNYCDFISNSAYNGSHVYNGEGSELKVSGCTFKDGWSDEAGGAIYNAGTASLDYVEVKENNARVGGGIYNSSDMQISNSLIWSNNTTIHGTDIANEGSLTNTTTEEQYNTWLNKYNLYYAGWYDDTNTSIGGTGDYMKFLTTTEAPSVEEPTEPTAPTEETEEPSSPEPEEPTTPEEEQPTEPPTGDNEGETGGDSSGEGEDQPSGDEGKTGDIPTTPDDGGESETPTTPSEEDNKPEEPSSPTSTPSDADKEDVSGGNVSNTTNSTTDNSQSNSSSSVVDNFSHESNDNSSYREDNSYRDSSSTVNNYYKQESPKQEPTAAQNGSQPINITVPVEVSTSQEKAAPMGSTELTEGAATSSPQQNIKIEAEGVDLVYEYTVNGVIISIKAPESPKEAEEAPAVNIASMLPETPQEADKSPNWVEYVSMILLAVLVGLEIKDKIKPHQEG